VGDGPHRVSEEGVRDVAALTPFPIGITRLSDGALVYLNEAFARFMQTTVADLLGKPAPDFYRDPADRDRMLARLRAEGELFDYEIAARIPDGSERLVVVNLQLLEFDGQPSIMASVADITERHRAETELRDERQRLAGILELAGEAIISIASNGEILLFNRGAEETFGYSREEILGSPLEVLLPENLHRPHREHVAGFIEGDVPSRRMGLRREVMGLRKDGSVFPAGISISKLGVGDQTMLTAIVQDLSAEREAEAALEQSRAQLRHSQKMEAIGRLAGGVAHDFNNLLTAILGSCVLISRSADMDSPIQSEVEEITMAADRAAKLTQQLLAFGRKQTMLPVVVDLRKVVTGARSMLARLIGEQVELRVSLGDAPVATLVDVGQLEQVLVNLVINAADAIGGSGTLTVTTAPRSLEADVQTEHGIIAAGAWATLTVEDTGTGMSEETLSRIFEPFFTTKSAGYGTGLGLPTVLGIVEQSGGTIEVDSTVGTGTTFRIYLPLSTDVAETEIPERGERVSLPGGNERILLVEDNHVLRRLCERILKAVGYDVLPAANGAEALAIADGLDHPADLILSDVIMPGLKGPELADLLCEKWPSVAVLFMTGYPDDVLGNRKDGASLALLNKPFHPDVLKARVRQALDERLDED